MKSLNMADCYQLGYDDVQGKKYNPNNVPYTGSYAQGYRHGKVKYHSEQRTVVDIRVTENCAMRKAYS